MSVSPKVVSEGEVGAYLFYPLLPFSSPFSYLCPTPPLFTVSADSSRELVAEGVSRRGALTRVCLFCPSSCHYSPLSVFQRTRCSCEASARRAVRFCCLVSPSPRWSWPPSFASRRCSGVFPRRLDVVGVGVVVVVVVVVCKLWPPALSQCAIFVLTTRCTD